MQCTQCFEEVVRESFSRPVDTTGRTGHVRLVLCQVRFHAVIKIIAGGLFHFLKSFQEK